GGPAYSWRQVDPDDGADGGQPGGNIRPVLLFDPRRVSFVDAPGASPARIEPAHPAFRKSRKPLVGEFDAAGRRLLVIVNHFISRIGDTPALAPSQVQRHAQA